MAKRLSAVYIGEDAYLYKGHINPEIILEEPQIVEEMVEYLEIKNIKSADFELDFMRFLEDDDKGYEFDDDADDDTIKEIENNFEVLVKRLQVLDTITFEFSQ
ncbi:MAG: hypothetical protein R3Y12_03805 [Clostridia bacterium]